MTSESTTAETPEAASPPPDAGAAPTGRDQRGQLPIGRLLELARKRAGFSESGACWALKITEWELARYESGVRTPGPSLLEEMSELYEVDFDNAKTEVTDTHMQIGWAEVDLSGCTDNESRLRRITSTLRAIRRLDLSTKIVVRTEEEAVLAEALDVDEPDLEGQLAAWLSIAPEEAADLAERMRGRG